ISRTLAEYQPPSAPLYNYQLLLASGFPERVDLNYSHQEKNILWDAFLLNTHDMILMGVFLLPLSIPLDIGLSLAHGILKSSLYEDLDISLPAFEEKLYKVSPLLKAHVLIGHAHLGSHIFSYKTNGEFQVHHIAFERKAILS